MHRHMLIGIDDSTRALKAARYGIKLAKSVNAMATAAIVSAPLGSIVPAEIAHGRLQSEYDASIQRHTERCLAKVRAISLEHRFVCETVHVSSAQPAESLLDLAAEQGCDLVILGLQQHRGTAGFELAQAAMSIVARSTIPILLYRE
jgi:nucleotide-binding universal stress UspA family protein